MQQPPSTISPADNLFSSSSEKKGLPYIMDTTRFDLQAGHILGLRELSYRAMLRIPPNISTINGQVADHTR